MVPVADSGGVCPAAVTPVAPTPSRDKGAVVASSVGLCRVGRGEPDTATAVLGPRTPQDPRVVSTEGECAAGDGTGCPPPLVSLCVTARDGALLLLVACAVLLLVACAVAGGTAVVTLVTKVSQPVEVVGRLALLGNVLVDPVVASMVARLVPVALESGTWVLLAVAEGAAPVVALSEWVVSTWAVVPVAPVLDAAVASHTFVWPTDSEVIPAVGLSSAVGGSGDGLAVTIVWLGAGPAALAPGFSSVLTSRSPIPTASPVVLPSVWGSPGAPIACSGAARDGEDMTVAISWGILDGDTSRAIPTLSLPSRRGGTSACEAVGTVTALGPLGVSDTALPMLGAVLGDGISVPGTSTIWGPALSTGVSADLGVTPVPGLVEPAVGPGWLWLGCASGTGRVASVSPGIVVALPLASDADPIPASLIGGLLTKEDRCVAGTVPMPNTVMEGGGAAAAARGVLSGFAALVPVRDKGTAMLGVAGGDLPAAASAVVVPSPVERD